MCGVGGMRRGAWWGFWGWFAPGTSLAMTLRVGVVVVVGKGVLVVV